MQDIVQQPLYEQVESQNNTVQPFICEQAESQEIPKLSNSSEEENRVPTAQEVRLLRSELIKAICDFIALFPCDPQYPGFPAIIGSPHNESTQLQPHMKPIEFVKLMGRGEIGIIVGSIAQFNQLENIMNHFLEKDWTAVKREKKKDVDGNLIVSYGIGKKTCALITLCQPVADSFALDLHIRKSFKFESQEEIICNIALPCNPTLMGIYPYRRSPVAGFILNLIDPKEISGDDIFAYAALKSYFLVRNEAYATLLTQEKQNTAEAVHVDSVQLGYSDRHPMEEILESSRFCQVLHCLKHDSTIRLNMFTQDQSKTGHMRVGSVENTIKKVLAIAQDNTESSNEKIFSEPLKDKISEFLNAEEKFIKKYHRLPYIPYLGYADCTAVATKNKNVELAEKLAPILLSMLDEINENTAFKNINSQTFSFSELLLKYLIYDTHREQTTLNQLMFKLAEVSTKISRSVSISGQYFRDQPWCMLPNIMLITLSNAVNKNVTFEPNTNAKIMLALGKIMEASFVQGDFYILASVINFLSKNINFFKLNPIAPEFSPVLITLRQFLYVLSGIIEGIEKYPFDPVNLAHTIKGITEDLQGLKKYFPFDQALSDRLSTIQITVSQIMAKHDEAISNLEEERSKNTSQKEPNQKKKKKKKNGNNLSKTTETLTPPDKTIEKTPCQKQWEVLLDEAVSLITQKQYQEGHERMIAALEEVQNDTEKGYIYIACGDAYILSDINLLNKTLKLAYDCDKLLQQTKAVSDELENNIKNFGLPRAKELFGQEKKLFNLKTLKNLVKRFPNKNQTVCLRKIIENAVDLYLQGLESLSTNREYNSTIMCKITQSELTELIKNTDCISRAEKNIVECVEKRKEPLEKVGLYGYSLGLTEQSEFKTISDEMNDKPTKLSDIIPKDKMASCASEMKKIQRKE